MLIFALLLAIFVLGYTAIALEHPLHIDKAASALLIGVLVWAVYALNAETVLSLGFSPSWAEAQQTAHYIKELVVPTAGEQLGSHLNHAVEMGHDKIHFVKSELGHHLIEIAEILFFLLGAMTIVETVDQYRGFKVITDKITTKSKVKLLWILGVLAFFMSAVLDNLTTTIVMIALLRKLIEDQKTRWFFASIIVLAANAGGAWSPIGDVTTIMLWVKGNVTTGPIIRDVILPSIVTLLLPLIILTFTMKGTIETPVDDDNADEITSPRARLVMLLIGVAALLFVPVFKTVTHLPPYMGMLFGLGVIWLVTEFALRTRGHKYDRRHFSVIGVLRKIDTPTIFFFLGILTAVAALQSAGHLAQLAGWLDDVTGRNIYAINLVIGVLSSIVDNVPLVAGAMGMYSIGAGEFAIDGAFWQLLAYCAGTGGSILIIGSAAGVAAMGLEKINFIWYFKKISILALIGYLGGAAVYYLQHILLH